MKQLSDAQSLRYCRHILMPEFDFEGQERLLNSKALIIGLGGLGSSAAPFLASSGVGELSLVDFDNVEISNLQRQIIHTESHIGHAKVNSARDFIAGLNSECKVNCVIERLTDNALAQLIKEHHVVLDCTDNLATREQINKLCWQHKIPLVSGAAIRFEGQLTSFNWQENTPCYHCLSQRFAEQQLSCVESGVLSPLVGVIGAFQALEAIKLLTQIGQPLVARLMLIDAMQSTSQTFNYHPVAGCKVCGDTNSIA